MTLAEEMAWIDRALWEALGDPAGRQAFKILYARLQSHRQRLAAWRRR